MRRKFVRNLRLPPPRDAVIPISAIATAKRFDDAVGIFNHDHKPEAWVAIEAEDPVLREEHFQKTMDILYAIIEEPETAMQPNWDFLRDTKSSAQSAKTTGSK